MASATVGDVPAWILDGRGGSRQNNFSTWGTPIIPVLKHRAGRTDITDTHVAGAWNEMTRIYSNELIPATHIGRLVDIGTWLVALP